MTKCERCGENRSFGGYIVNTWHCCGYGSPAEIEQRERATRAATLNMTYNESLGRCSEDFLSVTKERDQLRADLATAKALCEGCSGKAMVERIDSLTAQLAHKETVEQEREILAKQALQNMRHPTEGLTIFLLVQEFVAASKIVEAVKAHREFVRGQFEKLSLTGECDVIFNLGEILDDCLSGKKPEGI